MTAPPPDPTNAPAFTVAELSQALRRTVEGAFARVRVRGELSRVTTSRLGHVYTQMKDADACLDAVIWKGQVRGLAIKPVEGLEVIATGRLTTYAQTSKYQLIIESLELAGEGALLKMLEERRRRLAAEGLFAPERKRPLPFLPRVIGVVTSPSGAVIRDILHRLRERFPVHVLVWPVPVQGTGAAQAVAAAIAGFNALPPGGRVPRPDVLIVARGGGSLEDLMAFNEEAVARAAAASAIPLIAAVGHETDTTLIDHAADRRAPTPTAAAEMAVPVRAQLIEQVRGCGQRLDGAALRRLAHLGTQLEAARRGLGDPRRLLDSAEQRLDGLGTRLERGFAGDLAARAGRLAEAAARLPHPRLRLAEAARRLAEGGTALERAARRRLTGLPEALAALAARLDGAARRLPERPAERLEALGRRLDSVSFHRVLERGFALVRTADGRPITRAEATHPAQALNVQFQDGTIAARVEGGETTSDVSPTPTSPGAAEVPDGTSPRPSRRRTPPAGQPRLL